MHRKILVAYFAALMTLGAVVTGCGGHRELVGNWIVVDSDAVPNGLRQMTFADEHHLKLANGDLCEYTAVSDAIVKITYPDGKTYDYGYSRSGEYLTLVDNNRKIHYTLNQG
jgi:hypothetical protein